MPKAKPERTHKAIQIAESACGVVCSEGPITWTVTGFPTVAAALDWIAGQRRNQLSEAADTAD
jgi:hypothetical protein